VIRVWVFDGRNGLLYGRSNRYGRKKGIDGRREGIYDLLYRRRNVFWVEFAAFWVSLIECYGTCLRVRGFILFFILILIKINRKDL
jgi:hypothetical protein